MKLALGSAKGSLEAIEQQPAVGQPGQGVRCCQANQILFVLDPPSDVSIDAKGAAGSSFIVKERHHDAFNPPDRAVTVQHFDLTGPFALLFNGCEDVGRPIKLILDVQDADRLTDCFLARPPVEPLCTGIPVDDKTLEVSDDDGVENVFKGSGSLFESPVIHPTDPSIASTGSDVKVRHQRRTYQSCQVGVRLYRSQAFVTDPAAPRYAL